MGREIRALDEHGGSTKHQVSTMIAPLTSRAHFRRVAADDEYMLQTVTLFKKVKEEYTHKCRENK